MMERFIAVVRREPLIGFFAVGALLFALEGAAPPEVSRDGPSEARVLVIDEGVRRALRDGYLHQYGAEPTAEQERAELEAWVDAEILYREGLARRLDEGDERVRARVITLMADLLAAEHPAIEPTEAEVRAFFEADPARWAEPARIDFVHVFVSEAPDAEVRAAALLTALREGASPARMGDSFSGGRHYRGRRLEDLREAFGEDFTRAIEAQAIGTWEMAHSRFGWHVVQIEARSLGGDAAFERVRADVARALTLERNEESARRATEALRARWTIEGRD